MKIAIIVWAFPPKWLGGAEIAAYNIAKGLVQVGHEVYIITSLDEGLPGESVEQGFYVHRLSVPRVRFLGFIIFCSKALLRLQRLKTDIVHGQNITRGVVGLLAKKLLKKPYIVWGRGSDIYLSWPLKKPISKLVLKHADAVIALTEDMKTEMRRICSRNVYVIPNGIDLESYENLPAKVVLREKLGLDVGDRIILFVGTLRPVKGVKYLIEAMNIIRRKNTTARLMLVGDGEERQSLEGLAKELNSGDSVTFVGKVPNERIPAYMAAADIFVLPSLSEGFPVTVLEGIAAGLPVVASRVGGLPEIIEEGENGFLVEPRNPEQIADRVLRILENDELRGIISKSNREKAKQYSWEAVCRRLEAVYFQVVSGRQVI